MPNVADYSIVSDGNVDLKIGGDIDRTFDFNIPTTAVLNQSAILSFQLDTGTGGTPSGLKWRADINGTKIGGWTHNARDFCAVQEVFGGSVLKKGSNSATVTVESGTGTLRVSDIVVWFQNAA